MRKALVAGAMVVLVGCVGGPDESARPVACTDPETVTNALRSCVLSAADDKTREGCFIELKVVCRFDDEGYVPKYWR